MSFADSPSGQVPCSYHPDVMTGLRCNHCGKPICPKCAVRTPVGQRCPDCAGVRSMPTIRTGSDVLLKSLGAGLAVAILVAVLWPMLPAWGFYLTLGMGFGVVETIARFSRNKRGADLQLGAMALITIGFALSRFLLAQKYGIEWEAISDMRPRAMRLLQLEAVPDIVYMALAYVIAWVRFK